MANGHENLIPKTTLTKGEAKAMGTKGGIKSGEVRKDKKIITETLALLLNSKVIDPDIKAQLEERGVTEHTELKAMCIGMVEQARKNPAAFKEILDRIEGKVTDKLDVNADISIILTGEVKDWAK